MECLLQARLAMAKGLQIAIASYFPNREIPVPRFYPPKDNKGKKVTHYGYSIRRVAKMYELPIRSLQRAIAADGEIKTRSEAHENDMTLTIAEEEALKGWCLHMHR